MRRKVVRGRSKSTGNRKCAPISKDEIASCQHESLRLPRIEIAERCPRCRLWVRADGQTFELASQAAALESTGPQLARADLSERAISAFCGD